MNKSTLIGVAVASGIAMASGVTAYTFLGKKSERVEQSSAASPSPFQ
jgi:hypothetical protein